MEMNPLYVNKAVSPIHLFGYTHTLLEQRKKKPTKEIPSTESQVHFSALLSSGRCEYLSKGRRTPYHQHPFPYFFSYTHRKAEQASMMLLSPSSLEFSMVPTHWFSFHYCLTILGRKLPTTLAPFSLSLPPTLLDLRFNMASEKGLGVKSAFAFHCILSATGSYHSRSHLCKLIFKSVKISLLNRQHLLQKSGRHGRVSLPLSIKVLSC